MSIKCGKCGGRHATVADVRDCHSTVVADSKARAEQAWAYLEGRGEAPEPRGSVAVLEKAKTAVHEDGMYKVGDRIFKVQRAIHGSGHLYAKELRQSTDGSWVFAYAPGALKLFSAEDRMTLEQAKEFGVLYGVCCRCGTALTDEKSIAAGIGPICAGKL